MAEPKDEIDEIMNEIASLQKEMADVPADAPDMVQDLESPAEDLAEQIGVEEEVADQESPSADPPPSTLKSESIEDFRGSEDDASMEETLSALKMSEEDEEMSKLNSAEEGSLTISLKGSMSLKLKYETEGREVTVAFEDRFLKVELSDGTEFKIPVGEAPTRKAA
jgi:hypothetical protein